MSSKAELSRPINFFLTFCLVLNFVGSNQAQNAYTSEDRQECLKSILCLKDDGNEHRETLITCIDDCYEEGQKGIWETAKESAKVDFYSLKDNKQRVVEFCNQDESIKNAIFSDVSTYCSDVVSASCKEGEDKNEKACDGMKWFVNCFFDRIDEFLDKKICECQSCKGPAV